MNTYGNLAMQRVHAEATEQFRQIENPEAVFSDLGERIASQVDMIATEMEQTTPSSPDEPYLERVGRLNSIRRQAEEIAMNEALTEFLPTSTPEPDETDRPSPERISELISDLRSRESEMPTEEFVEELRRLQQLSR